MGRLGLLACTQTLFYFSLRSFRKHRRACERSERARKKNKELFTSGTATSGQHFPRCYGLPFELLDWGKEALQYEKLIGHDVSELQFHLLVQLVPVPGTHFDPRE